MAPRVVGMVLLLAVIGFSGATTAPVWATGDDETALGVAMNSATVTLQDGLKASKRQGTPISAKFEIEDGKLQLSVYTVKDNDLTEVVVDPKTGAIAKAEKITDPEDLKAARAQKAAMAKAKMPLLMAVETVVDANRGFRAVSIFPDDDGANAKVTLLAAGSFKKVQQKLDCGYNIC
jgi:hypothetical protein